MIDLLTISVNQSLADYTEARYHKRSIFSITARDGKIEQLEKGIVEGACIRVLVDGSLGFCSTTRLDKKGIIKALETATCLASVLKTQTPHIKIKFAEIKTRSDKYRTPLKKDPFSEDLSELVELVRDADDLIHSFKFIVSDTVNLTIVDDYETFVNSIGSRIMQRIVRCFAATMAVARIKGKIASAYEIIGAQAGIESYDDSLFDISKTTAQRATKIAPKKGSAWRRLSSSVRK